MSTNIPRTLKREPLTTPGLVARGSTAAEHKQMIPRPNSAPAYYQGRRADLLIAALSTRRKRTASGLASTAGVAA